MLSIIGCSSDEEKYTEGKDAYWDEDYKTALVLLTPFEMTSGGLLRGQKSPKLLSTAAYKLGHDLLGRSSRMCLPTVTLKYYIFPSK